MGHHAQKMVPLVMGLDPSPMRLGFGFVELLTGKPRWCGTAHIYLPDKGWRDKQLKRAFTNIKQSLTDKRDAHYTVPLIVIEQMFVGPNPKTSLDLANVAGWTGGIASGFWDDALFDFYAPAEWRKSNGLPGNATKEDCYAKAVSLGFDPPPRLKDKKKDTGQDAADAALMARAGWIAAAAKSRKVADG